MNTTKNKKFIPRGEAIKIQTYHIPTGTIKLWPSVHKFRKHTAYGAFNTRQLNDLRKNKLIKTKDYFICNQEGDFKIEYLNIFLYNNIRNK